MCNSDDWKCFSNSKYCKVHKIEFNSIKCPKETKVISDGTYGEHGTLVKSEPINHVSGGRVGSDYSCYVPHNARFYFNFNKWNFKPNFNFKSINSGSELVLNYFLGCRFSVKKDLIEVVNKVDSHRVFKVFGSASERKQIVDDSINTLKNECISALREFIKEFGGSSDFVIIKSWIPDNKITNERIIDSVPKDFTFRNEVVKKVYSDSDVEFSEPTFASNYFRNAGLKDYVPEIESRLNNLNSEFNRFESEALNPLTEQIKLHLEVQRETLATLKAIQSSLKFNNVRKLKDDWW